MRRISDILPRQNVFLSQVFRDYDFEPLSSSIAKQERGIARLLYVLSFCFVFVLVFCCLLRQGLGCVVTPGVKLTM